MVLTSRSNHATLPENLTEVPYHSLFEVTYKYLRACIVSTLSHSRLKPQLLPEGIHHQYTAQCCVVSQHQRGAPDCII